MPILEAPGAFQVVLPDGWTATGVPGKEYDLVPPDGMEMAITISVYPRPSKKDSGPDGSVNAVRSFAGRLGVENPSSLEIFTPHERGQQRSFAQVRTNDLAWFIGCLFFKRVFVLATVNASHRDEHALALGETIVASIAPR